MPRRTLLTFSRSLQAHCRQMTVGARTAACKRFMTSLSQLLNSLTLWASNDGNSSNMTEAQRAQEHQFLQSSLDKLESVSPNRSLEASIFGCRSTTLPLFLLSSLGETVFGRIQTNIP
jgi:hypothetical protein